jgi:hypothetical protein
MNTSFCRSALTSLAVTLILPNPTMGEPLSCTKILDMLKGGITKEKVIAEIKASRTSCVPAEEMIYQVFEAGGGRETIAAIKDAANSGSNTNPLPDTTRPKPPEPKITGRLEIKSPKEKSQSGSPCRVEGTATPIPNRHLWMFAHREDLDGMWWPQEREIKLKPDGRWVHAASLGGPDDTNFYFEVVVQWVNERTHSEMERYMADAKAIKDYKPISLPDGDLRTMLTVMKIR